MVAERVPLHEPHGPRGRLDQPEEHPDRRGLAGAVGAEEPDDLPPTDREGDRADLFGAIVLDGLLEADYRFYGRRSLIHQRVWSGGRSRWQARPSIYPVVWVRRPGRRLLSLHPYP